MNTKKNNTHSEENEASSQKISFEAAINKTGFGLYSYLITCLTGVCIISFGCVSFSSMYIVPTSACELATTPSQQGILAAGPVFGLILGGIGWGYLADTRGRRAMLLVSLIGGATFNMIGTISVNWIMLLIFQLLAALFTSGVYSMVMTLLSESVPMAQRNLVLLLVSSIFLLTQGIMALLAMPIIPLSFSHHLPALGIYWNSWRLLMLIYSIPGLITAVFVYFIHESPKFVYVKGDQARALEILKTIHRINNRSSKEDFQVEGLMLETPTAPTSPAVKDQLIPLFKAPLLKYTIIILFLKVAQQTGAFFVWLPTIADQFVRIIQDGGSSDLTVCAIMNLEPTPADPDATPCALNKTSLYMVLGIGVLMSFVNICISLSVNTIGRRNIAMILTTVCGLSGILVNLVPNAIGSAVLFAIFLQGIISVGLYTAIIVALFPTQLRAMAIALTMSGARLSQFASIQVLNLLLVNYCDVGFYLFASLLTSSAICASLLPDDRKLKITQSAPVKEKTLELESNKIDEGGS